MTTVKHQKHIRDLILSVIAYADLYEFPLTISEIHADIPTASISVDELKSQLATSDGLSKIIDNRDDYYFLKGRDFLVEMREQKLKTTQKLLEKHKHEIGRICRLPWVRTVMLTGSAAFDNAREGDDIDLFIIVQSSRLWLVDLYNLFILRIWQEKILRKPRAVCMNYIIDEAAISLQERDFFTAHQLVHMKHIYDEDTWHLFKTANKWAYEYFPNSVKTESTQSKPTKTKLALESCFNFIGAGFVNSLLYLIRGKRLNRKRRNGLLKGEYSLRRLKANDSRFADIVQMNLVDNLNKYSSNDGLIKGILKSGIDVSILNYIYDCIPENNEIDKFLNYYISKLPADEVCISDNEVLNLPFVSRKNNEKGYWNLRSRSYQKVMGLIRSIEPDGDGPLLDLGAGNCWLSRRLIEVGYRTISLDPLVKGIAGLASGDIFNKQPHVKLIRVRGLMEDMPFIDASFKGIVASGSFHYSNNPKKSLLEISRVLQSDGWAVIYDSPVFKREKDGVDMVNNQLESFGSRSAFLNIDYKPKWFINLTEFIQQSSDAGLEVEIIHTRDGIRYFADILKNKATSKRKWPRFPILLLTKSGTEQKPETPDIISKLRYYYYRQYLELNLIPGKEFEIDTIKLKVGVGVFHPLPYDSSRILLQVLKENYSELQSKSVLDMGTGSGIHAIAASKLGATVTGVDINPYAIETATENAQLNGVGENIRFIKSNLFDNIEKEKFDLILFNHPYYERDAENFEDMAWFDNKNETLISFLGKLPDYLSPSGEALLITSERMNLNRITSLCMKLGLTCEIVKRKKVWDETYIVYSITIGELDEN